MSAIMLAIYVVVFGALFYFLLFLPQRRRRREAQDLLTKLSPGDEVVTASGIYGTTTQIANAAGVAVIGAVFFAAESALGTRPALFIASALFVLAIVTSAAFLSWMRRVVPN